MPHPRPLRLAFPLFTPSVRTALLVGALALAAPLAPVVADAADAPADADAAATPAADAVKADSGGAAVKAARSAPDAPFAIRPSVQNEPRAQTDPASGDLVMIGYELSALLAQSTGVHPRDMIGEGGVDLGKRYDVLLRAGPQKDRNLREVFAAGVPAALGLELERRTEKVPVNRLRRRAGDPPLAPSTAPAPRAEVGKGRIAATRLPMAELVALLRWRSPRPVLDETGLTGAYDFVLEWDESAGTPALFYALQDVGLEIVPDEGEFAFLVVRPKP
ncbi:MAG: TIGR03435 family protein [Myxococcota bacterium]